MKTLITIFLLHTLIHGTTSWAGNATGNGGDSIVCRNEKGNIISAELLDYYEAREMGDMSIHFGDIQSFRQGVQKLIARIGKHDGRDVFFRTWFQQFLDPQNTEYVDFPLVDISDSKEVLIPTDCKVEQTAIFYLERNENGKLYRISREIWNALDAKNKAGLVMHELLYRYVKEEPSKDIVEHTNSRRVRAMNALIASANFHHLTLKQYIEKLQENHFVRYLSKNQEVEVQLLIKVHGKLLLMQDNHPRDLTFDENEQLRFFRKISPSRHKANFTSPGLSHTWCREGQCLKTDIASGYGRFEKAKSSQKGQSMYIDFNLSTSYDLTELDPKTNKPVRKLVSIKGNSIKKVPNQNCGGTDACSLPIELRFHHKKGIYDSKQGYRWGGITRVNPFPFINGSDYVVAHISSLRIDNKGLYMRFSDASEKIKGSKTEYYFRGSQMTQVCNDKGTCLTDPTDMYEFYSNKGRGAIEVSETKHTQLSHAIDSVIKKCRNALINSELNYKNYYCGQSPDCFKLAGKTKFTCKAETFHRLL